MNGNEIFFPAEWHEQRAVQLTWPKLDSDWNYIFDEVEKCFINIAAEIAVRQRLWIVCNSQNMVEHHFSEELLKNITFFEIDSNDTWARDHGGISVFRNEEPVVYDFCFNGWGMKFLANNDNLINRKLNEQNAFGNVAFENMNFFVLEGGSIESDGAGTLMTTETCLLSGNRNNSLSKNEIETCLKQFFGSEQVLWLRNGYLAGDDTDSHIDTLARFIPGNKITYVQCSDQTDEHYDALKQMEEELHHCKNAYGKPYELVTLPMTTPVFDKDDRHRLPATYANFLIMNEAVLFPIYNVDTDEEAIKVMKKAMPDYEIVPVDCSTLIRQHGSLHCVTMQYPKI